MTWRSLKNKPHENKYDLVLSNLRYLYAGELCKIGEQGRSAKGRRKGAQNTKVTWLNQMLEKIHNAQLDNIRAITENHREFLSPAEYKQYLLSSFENWQRRGSDTTGVLWQLSRTQESIDAVRSFLTAEAQESGLNVDARVSGPDPEMP